MGVYFANAGTNTKHTRNVCFRVLHGFPSSYPCCPSFPILENACSPVCTRARLLTGRVWKGLDSSRADEEGSWPPAARSVGKMDRTLRRFAEPWGGGAHISPRFAGGTGSEARAVQGRHQEDQIPPLTYAGLTICVKAAATSARARRARPRVSQSQM